VIFGGSDVLGTIASIVGVTSLIFVAKGYVIGQILMVIFAVVYGIISLWFRYYGEMITYVGMSAPMAVVSMIAWLKNPYQKSKEVKVNKVNSKQLAMGLMLTVIVTVAFYFILGALNTANLVISTLSITTSFLAAYLTYLRSPYYALVYALNDVVLIVLWVYACISDMSYLPMIICFSMFLVNDLYGFYNWKRMAKRQSVGFGE
jgi:nicotinamide mononucleotide transporter PnuC